jgi:hypothetical protein
MDLRCEFIKHAELIEPGVVEFKCRSRKCGHGPGIVVLHRFDTNSGELLSTNIFKDPEGVKNGTSQQRNPVWDAADSADSVH